MTPLVFVHGFMGGSEQWEKQLDELSKEYKLITIDLPGFGKNNQLPAINSIYSFSKWVIAELKKKNIKKYHLLGHSMGGMIVQEMVRTDSQNIDKLILYGTGSLGILPGRFETIMHSKTRAKNDGASETAARISATWFLDYHNSIAYEGCSKIAKRSSIESILAGLDAMSEWSGEQNLKKLENKTLIIWGDQDRTYLWPQIEILWKNIKNSNLSVIPGCAHAVHLEKPEIFNKVIKDFLNSV
ncbi:MAG: alpha/beta hydrolase [Amylibacter sp.]|jgi:pimeloyl-ACP methyl ester carboxylesterase|tara:strand:- start:1883 stop:2608 length:726 start_codon:yes stop_codon:yes gene_type:complete